MNKFIYVPRTDAIKVPSEAVINPVPLLQTNYTPVRLNFFFTVDNVLIQSESLLVPYVNKRACDLVGECLSFSSVVYPVHMCEYPYVLEGEIVFDLLAELTKLQLSSQDLLNFYAMHFSSLDGARLLTHLQSDGKAI